MTPSTEPTAGGGAAGSTNGTKSASTGAPNGAASGAPNGASNGAAAGATVSESTTQLSRGAITNLTPPPPPAPEVEAPTAPTAQVPVAEAPAQATPRAAGARTATSARPTATSARPATAAAARKAKGPRRVRLAVARVDPWSVMKMSFLLSVAIGIAGVVLTAVLWMILSTMNVFTDIEGVLQSLQTSQTDPFSIKDYVGFGRVVSLSIVIGVIDVILLTAISTVMAFLYNICSALVGGVQLTLTDD
ncbi:DUF3566 domain-containing protein [Intrasporangium oryzae]|uniref:DUF3566 domain-containing protein n=1 Tax=Intrasporangium oryzae TaxID=412687 RepID=UPI001FE08480|nr:DUF3566 domain-containing protein [Intrasporangium oryzae]